MYSSYNVNDPSCPSHSVVVHPGQSIRVRLSYATVFNDIDCSIKSDFLELEEEFFQRGGKTFIFRQKFDFESWSEVSTTFLGEISFHQDESQEPAPNQQMPNLCVFLQSKNHFKRDIITAVNPHGGQTVKVHTHQILEVVVFNQIWGQELLWKYESDGDNRMQLLATGVIDPTSYKFEECAKSVNDAFFTYPRMITPGDQSYQEYHFWFRCNPTVASVIKLFDDHYPPGELIFSGRVQGNVRAEHRIGVLFNERQKTPSRAGVVTFEDSSMDQGQVSSYTTPTLRPLDTWRSRLARQMNHPAKSNDFPANNSIVPQDYDLDREFYGSRSSHRLSKAERRAAKQAAKQNILGTPVRTEKPKNRHQHQYTGATTYSYRKNTEKRMVVVKIKNFALLEDGCKIHYHDDLSIPVNSTGSTNKSLTCLPAPAKHIGTEPETLNKIYQEMQSWD